MIKKLYVFSNCGHLKELPKSGGQTSARRVMDGLRNAGLEIVPIRRHRTELEGKVLHRLEVGWFAVYDLSKIVARTMLGSRRNSAFMMLSYSGSLVPYELVISIVMKLMGYRSLLYMKGGMVIDYYAHGGKVHKWMFKKIADLQTKMFFEGMDSLRIVENVSKTPCVYFPNYIFDNMIPCHLDSRPTDKINMLYFGRIAPDKNVHVVVDSFNILADKYKNITLTIIGGKGFYQAYVDKVDDMIRTSPYADRITRMGNTPFTEIMEMMRKQHLFIFPSKAKCEGHSNALNEAMSQGLVPVVSDYHFNRTIVGDEKFVVKSFDAKDYADRIEQLMQEDLQALSIQCWNRIKEKYTYAVVNDRIVNEIRFID